MICPECGKKLPENAVKCNKCGKVFKEVKTGGENDEFLKKEKEKAASKAKKLSEKNQNKEENSKKTRKALKIIIPCIAVIVAAAVAFALIISNKNKKEQEFIKENCPEKLIEYTYPDVPDEEAVMKFGDVNISKAEYEFFYRQSFSNTQNFAQLDFKQYMGEKLGEEFNENANYYDEYYAEYAKDKHNIFDFTKPINNQSENALDENGNEISWQEYIRNDAINTMMGYHVKFELARKSGMELTDDIRYQVYTHIEGLRDAIKGSSYQNLTQYLKILFGNACDEEFFKNILIREYMAKKYDNTAGINKIDSYDGSEIEKEYKEKQTDYDYIDLYVYEVSGDKAEKTADKILKAVKDADSFTAAVQKYDGSSLDKRYMPKVPKQYVDGEYSEKLGKWAFDSGRKAGDKGVFKSNNGYTVALLQTPMYTSDNCVSYREIVISKTDASGNILSDEEIAKAKERAGQIYAEWQEKGKTEDSFAYYAMAKSEGQTAADGGFVPAGIADDLSENLKNWITDKSRKAGDTELIDTDSSYTVVYFLKNYGKYWNYAVRAGKAGTDTAKDYSDALSSTYVKTFDSSVLFDTEETMIAEMNRLYFGIG